MKKVNEATITVAESGGEFCIWTMKGPHQTYNFGFCKCVPGNPPLAWSLSNALRITPYNSFARVAHGPVYADKRLPVLVRTSSAEFVSECLALETTSDPPLPLAMLYNALKRYSFKFELIPEDETQKLVYRFWEVI